jgi:hypothetical protein
VDLDKACTFLSTYDEITRWDGTSRPDSLRAVRRPLELGIALLVDCSDVVKRAGDLAIPDGPPLAPAELRAWTLAECRLLDDLGCRPSWVSKVRDYLLSPEAQSAAPSSTALSLEPLVAQLQIDLGEVAANDASSAAADRFRARRDEREDRVSGTAWIVSGCVLLAVNEAIVAGAFPITGGLSAVGASLSPTLAFRLWRKGQGVFTLREP